MTAFKLFLEQCHILETSLAVTVHLLTIMTEDTLPHYCPTFYRDCESYPALWESASSLNIYVIDMKCFRIFDHAV